MSRRRTPSLIHRGYLYAQARPTEATEFETNAANQATVSARRMKMAEAWKNGYLAALRDAKKTRTT